jgi:RimJ/RimL family protein N-acetyltransferase
VAVVLRALTERDAVLASDWFREPETSRWLGDETWPHSLLALAEHSRDRFAYAADEDGTLVAIADAEREDDGRAAVAVVVAPERRRQGIGRSVITALVAREELAALDLLAGIEVGNEAGHALVRAVGFEPLSLEPDADAFVYFVRRA